MFAVVLLVSLAAIELGHRLGLKRREESEGEAMLGSTVGAHMGLLAFMLAFTFGFAANRLDMRRALVIDEANAVVTADLRARMMLPEHAKRAHAILTEYTEVRAVLLPQGKISMEEAARRSSRLLEDLWKVTEVAALEDEPTDELRSLFVSAVGEVIETNTRRVTVVLSGRIPPLIWLALGLITVLGLSALGYQGGLKGRARSLASLPLVVSFCAVITLIIDLDRPIGTLIHVSQGALVGTLDYMEHEKPRR